MLRHRVSKARDNRIFKKTASRTPSLNVNPPAYRGGIRL